MPRVIKNDDGTETEVFEKAEVESVKSELEAKLNEVQQEVNPNWREMRQKYSTQEKELAELRAKAGVQTEKSLTQEDVERIANQKYLDSYKNRVMSQYGEKSEAVKKAFEKLATGETLNEDTIDRIAADAARFVGVKSATSSSRASYIPQSPRPQFEADATDQGFGTTEAGKATAAAMGIIIEKPKN